MMTTSVEIPELLSEYEPERRFAERMGVHQKTIARARLKPNGLPYMRWCGQVWIYLPGAREYFAAITKRPNPRRAA